MSAHAGAEGLEDSDSRTAGQTGTPRILHVITGKWPSMFRIHATNSPKVPQVAPK
jgi:hypothetical protein